MCVTNNIRDKVEYDNFSDWKDVELTNSEILELLQKESDKGFLVFSWGVYVTSLARRNLLERIIEGLDDYQIYADTDSLKLVEGYNKQIIEDYNKKVLEKLQKASKHFDIPLERFMPKDKKGKERPLGVFDFEKEKYNKHSYEKFITQGAKKYAYIERIKNKDVKKGSNVINKDSEYSEVLKITVSGVPKKGANALKSLDDFRDDFVFKYEDTGKNLLYYIDDAKPIYISDYQGNTELITQKTGSCIVPTTYVLGKAEEYADLIEESSKRAIYKE